jgi:hypothetical protein
MKNLICMLIAVSLAVMTQAEDTQHCDDPEYKALEGQFSDLESLEKEWFFVLDKKCLQELGLSNDDISARRTVFLMGAMNYEGYDVGE